MHTAFKLLPVLPGNGPARCSVMFACARTRRHPAAAALAAKITRRGLALAEVRQEAQRREPGTRYSVLRHARDRAE